MASPAHNLETPIKHPLTAVFLGLLLAVISVPGATQASEKLKDTISTEWGGHLRAGGRASSVDDRSIYGAVGAGTYLDGETDFRLKNKTWAGEIYSFEWHYEAILTGGNTREQNNALRAAGGSGPGNALLPPAYISDQTSFFNLSGVIAEGENYIAYHRLDRLVLAAQPAWGTAAIGRQALTWGNGLVFNPMDLFNPFRPTDMERDYKVGEDMVLLQVQDWKADDIQMVYVPRRNPQTGEVSQARSSLAGKLHQAFTSFEIDLMAGLQYDNPVAGFGVARPLGGAIWRFDLTWTRLRDRETDADFLTGVTNLDYAWTWGGKNVYGLLEYYYNGLGKSDYADAFADPDMLAMLARGEMFTLGRNYLAGQLQVEVHPLVLLSLGVINNLADPSGTVQPRMEWNAAQNVQVVLSGTTHYGAAGSEYGGFYVPQVGVWHMPVDSVYGRVSLFF